MEKQLLTALLVLVLVAPQAGLEAKSRHHGVKERDHHAEDRDDEANKRHKSKKRHHKSKKRHHKSKKHHHSSRKFFRFERGTKAELNLVELNLHSVQCHHHQFEDSLDLRSTPDSRN